MKIDAEKRIPCGQPVAGQQAAFCILAGLSKIRMVSQRPRPGDATV